MPNNPKKNLEKGITVAVASGVSIIVVGIAKAGAESLGISLPDAVGSELSNAVSGAITAAIAGALIAAQNWWKHRKTV